MKIACERKPFAEAFALAAQLARPKSPNPMLSYVLMDLASGVDHLISTDGDRSVRIVLPPLTVEGAGKILLDGEKVNQALGSMRGDEVTIEEVGPNVKFSSGRSSVVLPGADPEKYPTFPEPPSGVPSWDLDPTQLWLLADRTMFAADEKSTNYGLGGCKFEATEDRMSFAATDGNRIAVQSIGNRSKVPLDPKATVLLPPASLKVAMRVFKDGDPLRMSFSGPEKAPHLGHFSGPLAQVCTRMVEGRFPDYVRILPKASEVVAKVKVRAGDMKSALRLATIATDETSRAVSFAFGEGEVRVSGKAADRGQAGDSVECEFSGTPMEMAWDHRYLADLLARVDDSTPLTFGLVAPDKNTLITNDGGLTYMVAPLTTPKG
jgi:DNA polymerase-3 subunit beta